MHETVELARFVAGIGYDDLPIAVRETLRICAMDNLAAGCAGARTPWADVVADMAQHTSLGSCSVFGRSWTVSPSSAALCNGVMIGGFEVDHPFTPGSCHPSGGVFPALLAIAEQEHVDGRSFLAAMAAGYELLCRVGLAATRAVEDERGFHGPGTNASFGAAAAAAKLLGLSVEGITNALGIAGSCGGGLVEFFREGAMTKRLHLGRGAQLGLESALLAAGGFTGPSTVLEGDHGFLHAYSPAPRPELLTEGLGERYHLTGMTLKAYPCHISFHAVIEGIQRFRAEHSFEPAEIESVQITGTHRMMEERFLNRAPTTLMGAQYSLPWSAAFALCGDVAAPEAWAGADLADPAVLRLAATMELASDPSRFGATGGPAAEIGLTIGGRSYSFEVTNWKGAPTNPYRFDEIAQKFARYAAPILPGGRIEEITARVRDLEEEADMASLIQLIR